MHGANQAAGSLAKNEPRQAQILDAIEGLDRAVSNCEQAEEMLKQRLERACIPEAAQPGQASPGKLAEVHPIKAPLALTIDSTSRRLHALNERLMVLLNRIEV